MGQKIKKRKYWRKKTTKAIPAQKTGIIAKIKNLFGVKGNENKTSKTD